jgi:hypothetical protein
MNRFRPNGASQVARTTCSTPEDGSNSAIMKAQRELVPSAVAASLESLVGLRWYEGPDVRPVLLRVLTDLYVQRPSHSPEEEQQYVELALRLLDAVDAKTRTEVAGQLAAYAEAPAAVLCRLASGTAAVTKTAAKRSREPCRGGARSALDIRSSSSRMSAIASELNEIFFTASPIERRLILINLDYSNAPPTGQISAAHADEASRTLEAIALRGRLDEFVRELERTMKMSHKQAQRIVNDPSGEPLVVGARALAMPIDTLQRILLCVNPTVGHSVRRIYDLCALYRDISIESALRLVAIWRAAAPMTRVAVELHSSSSIDESRSPRDLSATPRRSSSRSAAGSPRFRHQLTR